MSCCSQQKPRSWGQQTGGLKVCTPHTHGTERDTLLLWVPESGMVRALCSVSFNTWTPCPRMDGDATLPHVQQGR